MSLKHHPDKGGESELFSKVNTAYGCLLLLQEEADELKTTTAIDYEVILEKCMGNVGMGISVIENKIRNVVTVSNVSER